MPWPAPKQCAKPGCPGLTQERFCAKHKRAESRRYDQERGSAAKRGYGRRWRKLAAMILERDPYCKAECCHEGSTDCDHIIPRREGGTNDPDNLQGLCHDCHSRNGARGRSLG